MSLSDLRQSWLQRADSRKQEGKTGSKLILECAKELKPFVIEESQRQAVREALDRAWGVVHRPDDNWQKRLVAALTEADAALSGKLS